MACTSCCSSKGIAHTSATDAALVVAASPAFIAIIGRVRGVERVSARGVFGIALSIAGIALVVLATASGNDGRASLFGDLLVLLGSLSWAIYTVLLKPYTERVPGMQLSAFTMAGGAIPLARRRDAGGVAHELVRDADARMGSRCSTAACSRSSSPTTSGTTAFACIGPTRTSMYSNLQPVIAVLMAWVLLHETPTIWQGVGAACIMTGLLLTRS